MKHLGVVLMWLTASGVATGVAWSGIGVLNDDLVDPAPAAIVDNSSNDGRSLQSEELSASSESNSAMLSDRSTLALLDGEENRSENGDISSDGNGHTNGDDDNDRRRNESSTTNTTDGGTSASAVTGSTSSATSGSTSSNQTSTTSSTSTTHQSSTTSQTTSRTSSTPPSTHSSTTTPTTGGTVSPPSSQAAQTKTFHLVGGSTAISFSPSGTAVIWATPNPGYEVKIEPESPGIKVEFRSDQHRSRIDAWWNNGPRHEIRERED